MRIKKVFFLLPLFLFLMQQEVVCQYHPWRRITGAEDHPVRELFRGSDGAIYAYSGFRFYRSTDGGELWREMEMEGMPAEKSLIWSVRQHPFENSLYLESNVDGVGMVYRSVDGGATWSLLATIGGCNAADISPVDANCFYLNCGRVSIHYQCAHTSATEANLGISPDEKNYLARIFPRRGGDAILGTRRGTLYATTNRGQLWQRADRGLEDKGIISLFAEEDTAWVGTSGAGIWRSTDLGESWQEMNTGLGRAPAQSLSVVCLERDPRGMLVAVTLGGVYTSLNGGNNWEETGFSVPDPSTGGHFAADTLGRYYWRTSQERLMVSPDGGATWEYRMTGFEFGPTEHLVIVGDSNYVLGRNVLFLGDNRTFYPEWRQCINGLPDPRIVSLTGLHDSTVLAFDSSGRAFRKPHNARMWSRQGNGLPGQRVRCSATGSWGNVYAGTAQGHVFRSSDVGAHWEDAQLPSGGAPVSALLLLYDSTVFCGTIGSGLYRSSDGGDTWDGSNAGLNHLDITALAAGPNGDLYAGSNGGGVFRSTDKGLHWSSIGPMLSGRYVSSIVVNAAGILAVGTLDAGLRISRNNGGTWTSSNDGLTDTRIVDLDLIDASIGHLAAVIADGSVWRFDYGMPTDVQHPLPEDPLHLEVPVPHPLGQRSEISYVTRSAGRIKLALYDMLGRMVAVFHDREVTAGRHTIMAETAGIPPGTYFLQLQTDVGSTGRVVLRLR